MKIIKLPIIIDSGLQQKIIDFAMCTNIGDFVVNPNGKNRRYCNLNTVDCELTNVVADFSKKCYDMIGIPYINEENIFGNFIGVNGEGAFVHEHTDPKNNLGYHHVRINFMIQKPFGGGNPVVDSIEYEINERVSWINIADLWKHKSTEVKGNKERIVLSLGNYVSPTDIILVGKRQGF